MNDRMLEELELVRLDSKVNFPGSIVTALGKGVKIIGLLNDSADDYVVVREYLDKGYQVVSNFLDGNPIGSGIIK